MRMDHYSTLGVNKNATPAEIKKAYRKLAMDHHPDRGGDPVKFQKISEAYDVLSNPQRRAEYDSPQSQANFNNFAQDFPGGFSFQFGGFDLNDLFQQSFGQRNPFGQQANNKPVYRTRVTVSLVDAYKGAEQVLQLGTPQGMRVVTVKVPAGIQNGNTIRYDTLIEDGTLIIEYAILPDNRFERHGDDLHSTVLISILDLIVGTTIQHTTISGKVLDVTIPAGTQPEQGMRFPGHGMPRSDGSYGNQILLLKPFTPAIDSDIVDFIKNKLNKGN